MVTLRMDGYIEVQKLLEMLYMSQRPIDPIEVLFIVSNNPGKLFQAWSERPKDSEETALWIRAIDGHFGACGLIHST